MYLPGNGKWLLWRFHDVEDVTLEEVSSGLHYFECPLESMLVFIPPESILVLNDRTQNSARLKTESFRLIENLTAEYTDLIRVDASTSYQLERSRTDLGAWEWSAKGPVGTQWTLVQEGRTFGTIECS